MVAHDDMPSGASAVLSEVTNGVPVEMSDWVQVNEHRELLYYQSFSSKSRCLEGGRKWQVNKLKNTAILLNCNSAGR